VRNKLALPGDTSLELSFYFLATALLQRVCTTGDDHRECKREKDRQALHLLILGMKRVKANGQVLWRCWYQAK
jgi:hypothetical protein